MKHEQITATEDHAANAGGRIIQPFVVDLESFSAKTHAGDCLLSLLTALTDEDVQETTVSDREKMVAELKAIKAHVEQGKSILLHAICSAVLTTAEYWLECAQQIAKEQRIDEDGLPC